MHSNITVTELHEKTERPWKYPVKTERVEISRKGTILKGILGINVRDEQGHKEALKLTSL